MPPDPAVVDRLDILLEQYLVLLDSYTTLREKLSREFSSGFFSLASANRSASSTLGAGRRYGPEGFSGKMKALRGTSVEPRFLAIGKAEEVEETQDTGRSAAGKGSEKQQMKEGSAETTSGSASDDGRREHFSVSSLQLWDSDKKSDPLRWYGIMSPPALRQCQSIFTTSITDTIPSLLTAISHLRAIEEEIWKLRGSLGVLHGYDYPSNAGTQEEEASQPNELPVRHALSPKKGLSNLVSRSKPVEPRPRVLKMD